MLLAKKLYKKAIELETDYHLKGGIVHRSLDFLAEYALGNYSDDAYNSEVVERLLFKHYVMLCNVAFVSMLKEYNQLYKTRWKIHNMIIAGANVYYHLRSGKFIVYHCNFRKHNKKDEMRNLHRLLGQFKGKKGKR
ncbi:hypothetical protein [Helicobacter cetorum]|uniref:hypothetical protein n=1 Tax=Helicobacter cetorum TaxID=138563 RepID=UPI000CF0EE32|nr:hypothetical protein [Helicobacter cetorum]